VWTGAFARPVRSRCMTCGDRIALWRMIPVVSFLIQGGRCGCPRRARLSRAYFTLEAGCVAGALLSLTAFGPSWTAVLAGLGFSFALWACVVDLRAGEIPDLAVVTLLATGLAAAIWAPVVAERGPAEAYGGALFVGSLFLIARTLVTRFKNREALGLGDVKLAFGLGMWTGPFLAGPFILLAALIGLGWAALARLSGQKASTGQPFAPAMVAAAVVVLALEQAGVPLRLQAWLNP